MIFYDFFNAVTALMSSFTALPCSPTVIKMLMVFTDDKTNPRRQPRLNDINCDIRVHFLLFFFLYQAFSEQQKILRFFFESLQEFWLSER